jgi:phosphoglycerate kinase
VESTAEVLRRKLQLADLSPEGQRVLVRADLNVPVQDGRVVDDTRIRASLPTLRALIEDGASLVVMSHMGRPKGEPDPELSMGPVAVVLQEQLGRPVHLLPDCVGPEVEERAAALLPGEVALLENLRFHAGEKANDPEFAASLARLAPLYVDDAFGAAHRAHASIVGVPAAVGTAAAGDLLQLEVSMLDKVLSDPSAPFVLVLGGAKVSDKLAVLENLLPLVDRLIVGGAMSNALLAAQGADVGGSWVEDGSLELAGRVLAAAADNDVEVFLPEDFVVAPAMDRPEDAREVSQVPADCMALDIGFSTRQRFAAALTDAKTVLWNGPMGVFEISAFSEGTRAVGKAIAALGPQALTVLGGGDTAAAAAADGISERVTHVSTGGGASLDLLSGRLLPGVAALTDRTSQDV